MLQQEDLSVVETVMRNVTVFARMRPGQKGQVMDLLGTRGLQQMYKGQQRTIPVSLLSPTDNSKYNCFTIDDSNNSDISS